jgi:NAD(P)-dependent dehydrogenase (short-subunit alcohol dehydrogenase family)
MRIMVIGATGTIGKAIVELLSPDHEIVSVAARSGDHRVDIASKASIENLFRKSGPVDAVMCAAGQARFGSLKELSDEDFMLGLTNKLMGQVNLVRVGWEYVAPEGSFTLTSGLLGQYPMPGSAAISMVNAGLEGFVRAAALEMQRGQRVNVVSPGWVAETLQAMGRKSEGALPAREVARAYKESLEGRQSGVVLSPSTAGGPARQDWSI